MLYTILDVVDGLAYRVAEVPDEDSERAADLHRALCCTNKQTSEVLSLWAEGHNLREISERLWQSNSPNRVRKILRDGLREVRGRMEQTSKCA